MQGAVVNLLHIIEQKILHNRFKIKELKNKKECHIKVKENILKKNKMNTKYEKKKYIFEICLKNKTYNKNNYFLMQFLTIFTIKVCFKSIY